MTKIAEPVHSGQTVRIVAAHPIGVSFNATIERPDPTAPPVGPIGAPNYLRPGDILTPNCKIAHGPLKGEHVAFEALGNGRMIGLYNWPNLQWDYRCFDFVRRPSDTPRRGDPVEPPFGSSESRIIRTDADVINDLRDALARLNALVVETNDRRLGVDFDTIDHAEGKPSIAGFKATVTSVLP